MLVAAVFNLRRPRLSQFHPNVVLPKTPPALLQNEGKIKETETAEETTVN